MRLSEFFSVLLISAGVTLIALAAWSLLSVSTPSSTAAGSAPTTQTGFTIEPTVLPVEPTEPAGVETAPVADIARLLVPRIGIDAEVVTYGVDADGVMQSPDSPEVVAWYDFSSRPGEDGNVVFAGHVDYANYGPAVFWSLRGLAAGDEVEVALVDGSSVTYSVVSVTSYAADDAPVAEIVGATAVESLTLITCGGSFDAASRQYDERLVVRAERVSAPPPA